VSIVTLVSVSTSIAVAGRDAYSRPVEPSRGRGATCSIDA